MKVIHFNVVRKLTPGQLNQLRYEYVSASTMTESTWEVIAYHTESSSDDFVLQLPWFFRLMFMRHLFAWLWLLKHSNKYDYVICRHMLFDPFSLIFSWFIPNRVTVHHGKETHELKLIREGWKGRVATMIERLAGRVSVRNAAAVLGVTDEIRSHEVAFHEYSKKIRSSIYPNGINAKDVLVIGDSRKKNRVELAFMCGTFSSWHGLDILLDQFDHECVLNELRLPVTLHLIGRLNDHQKESIDRINRSSSPHFINCHGTLSSDKYRSILECCHAGLSSLAIHRKGLTEASTLKVRELLAVGLPVYSGHKDSALPEEYPFYKNGGGSLEDIVEFSLSHIDTPRNEVRASAFQYIEKRSWMEHVMKFLRTSTG